MLNQTTRRNCVVVQNDVVGLLESLTKALRVLEFESIELPSLNVGIKDKVENRFPRQITSRLGQLFSLIEEAQSIVQ